MIAIRVVSRAGLPPATPLVARFSEAGGDIGRGADCTLVLADPERRISRRQALIGCRGGRYFIRQIGANLEVEIGDEPLAPDIEYPLDAGAEIRIGEYLLRVEAEAPAPSTVQAQRFSAPAPAPAPPPPSVFADLLGTPAPPPLPAHEIDLVIGDPTGTSQHEKRAKSAAAPAVPRGGDALGALFLGLGLEAPAQPSAAQLRAIGELLRELVAGTIELLAARSAAKRELGAAQTLVRKRENNPFKFSPDADAALALLLGAPQRGFLSPQEAARGAFADLRAHQVAVLAGMRAALDAVLSRFDPATLEPRLASAAGLWDSLVPVARKAKLWEQYAERYADILREVEGDFDTLFGRAFLQAYEAQIAALGREGKDRT